MTPRGIRLIQSGGWNRLRTQDEHTKLARIAVDLPRDADELFGVNVAKMRVALPESLRPELRALASAVTTRAQEKYRTRSSEPALSSLGPRAAAGPAEGIEILQAVLDIPSEFIPRARVVDLLRTLLADDPDRLRRVVNAVTLDDWHAIARELHEAPAAEQVEPAGKG